MSPGKQQLGFAVLLACLAMGWVREGVRRSGAEVYAAERDSMASVALDSAASYREQLSSALEAEAEARVTFEDSLVVWGARADDARQRAAEAVAGARVASAELAASLDSVQTVLLEELEAQHGIEVEAATELGREEGRAEVRTLLEPRISSLTAALETSMAETDQVRIAYEATRQAELALADELSSRKRGELLWKLAAGAGWVCAAVCR